MDGSMKGEEKRRKEMKARKVEVIKEAIKQVMDEDDYHHHQNNSNHRLRLRLRLLSDLMSQLERLEADDDHDINVLTFQQQQQQQENRILEELNKLKRHNFITHSLLSLMILLTAAWQISEVSIILKLRHGLTHPFRSFFTFFKSILKPPKPITNNDQQTHPLPDPSLSHLSLLTN